MGELTTGNPHIGFTGPGAVKIKEVIGRLSKQIKKY